MKLNLKVTLNCPANCLCCVERIGNHKTRIRTTLPLDELFEKILMIFAYVGDKDNNLSITGGEPTLVEGLATYVKRATDKKIAVGIDTNGWSLNEKWLREMEAAGLQHILLSIYSLEMKKFNYLRGATDNKLFSRMKDALELLADYKHNNGGINIRVQSVLMRQNYDELPKILTLAINSKFNALSTAYYISVNPNRELLMSLEDINNFKNKVAPEMVSILSNSRLPIPYLNENIQKINSFFQFEGMSLVDVGEGRYRKTTTSCVNTGYLAVYPNGDITPCLGFDYMWNAKYVLNLCRNSCKEILTHPILKNFWQKPYPLCERCSSGYQIWLVL